MQGGGAERVAALLCNHWAQAGHEILLVPTFSGRGECVYPLDESVRLEYLADRVRSTSGSTWNKVRRLLALRQMIRSERPDVVLSFLPHVNVAGLVVSGGLGVPVVVSERIFPPMLPVSRPLERLRRLTYPMASSVVVQTSQGLAWLHRTIPRSQGTVIPNPVVYPLPVGQPELRPADVLRSERQVLLAVGRLTKQKRLDLAVEGFAHLAAKHQDWDMVILGEGAEREALEKMRTRLGLDERLYLPGRVGNLGDWYQRASLYVLTSWFEGFPNTLLEAMAYGLPTVSVDCETGPADLIEDGLNGRLVPQSDQVSLVEALDALMRDSATSTRLGEAAAKVRERFSIDRVGEQWAVVLGLSVD